MRSAADAHSRALSRYCLRAARSPRVRRRFTAASPRRLLPEVGRRDARIRGELGARAFERELAGLQHVAVVGNLQRGPRVLLDQQDRHARSRAAPTTMLKISRTISGARPSDGSSSISSFGLPISARPIASICRSPPDSVPASWSRRSCRRGKRCVDLVQRARASRARRAARAGSRRARGCRRRSSPRTARAARARGSARARRAARRSARRRGAPR